jgi:hypothetical protein
MLAKSVTQKRKQEFLYPSIMDKITQNLTEIYFHYLAVPLY